MPWHGRTRCTENSGAIPAETCEAGPFAGPPGLRCFAREDAQKTPGRGPVRQRTKSRGAEENYKAAANMPRKIQKALAETILLSPRRAHVK